MALHSITGLFGRFVGRTDALTQRFHSPLPSDPAHQKTCHALRTDARLYLVIRLLMLWGEFCRELVIWSALGGLLTLRGHVLAPAPGVNGLADVENAAKKPLTGPRASWHWPAFSVEVANTLKVSNYNELSSGLGGANVADLIHVRNYIVHPNQFTRVEYAQAVSNLGLIAIPPEALIAYRLPGGATIFETWVADCQTAAFNAIH